MSTLEKAMTALVFAAYFGVPAGLLIAVIYRRQLATEEPATGRHHHGRLRAARRRIESSARTCQRAAAHRWRRLSVTPSPVPVTPAPLVHGLAGVA